MKQYNTQNGTMTPKLVIAAGAQAAAQGLVRSALLTKLLPFAAAASLVLRLFGKGRTDRPLDGLGAWSLSKRRPDAGNHNPAGAPEAAGRSRGAFPPLAAGTRRRGGSATPAARVINRRASP